LHGLGLLSDGQSPSVAVVIQALKHPAAGERRAAIQTLPKNAKVIDELISSGAVKDKDLRVRLAAILALSEAPPSPKVAKVIFDAVQDPENEKDKWLFHALMIAGSLHQQAFMHEYHTKFGHPDFSNANGSLGERIIAGNNMSVLSLNTARDGIIGPRQIPEIANREIHFVGTVRQKDQKPLDGALLSYGNKKDGYAVSIKDGRVEFRVNQKGNKSIIQSEKLSKPTFKVRTSLLADGKMLLFIDEEKVAEGKSLGLFPEKQDGFLLVGRASAARQQDQVPNDSPGDFAKDFKFTGTLEDGRLVAMNKADASEGKTVEADKVLKIKAIVGEMKYDITNFSAKAGSNLKIIFENPDHMQHNLLILKPGSLDRVGQAADKLATLNNAIELQYIPNTPDVLFSSSLVDPDGSYELNIKVPSEPGDYPFACTFPGHWRIMNGVMKVTK